MRLRERAERCSAVRDRVLGLVRWLLAPATDEVPKAQAGGAVFLRVLLALMWLHNVGWKIPPDFDSLSHFTAYAVSDPVFPPYSWIVEHVVLPNIEGFGWGVLAAETALAVMLLTGAWVRVAAALGVAQSIAIALSVALAPHEWVWSYWLMIGGHIAILFSSAGRVFAVDAVRDHHGSARRLAQWWGGIALVVGTVAALGSLQDPLTARGFSVTPWDHSAISFGRYNLLGALLLVLAGLLLIAAARRGPSMLGLVAAGPCAVAALVTYAQVGFTDPVLGDNQTAAALLLSIALVAAATSRPWGSHK